MRKIYILVLLMVALNSCFLFKDYRKKEFAYSSNGQNVSQPIIVPKGYTKQERIDSAGVSLFSFHYPDGAYIYAAYLADTSYQLQQFNKAIHQPLFHRLGGRVFKGQDENALFYREIRQGNLRFGYKNVPMSLEPLFDSATNFASLQRR